MLSKESYLQLSTTLTFVSIVDVEPQMHCKRRRPTTTMMVHRLEALSVLLLLSIAARNGQRIHSCRQRTIATIVGGSCCGCCSCCVGGYYIDYADHCSCRVCRLVVVAAAVVDGDDAHRNAAAWRAEYYHPRRRRRSEAVRLIYFCSPSFSSSS